MDGTILEKKLKIEEKLAQLNEIAQKVDDMPTFTSDDRAFLEELPGFPATDGKKVLTATTESGETSLAYEEVESGKNYSTTPVKTGEKWIDGKDIYRVVFTTGAVSAGAGVDITHGLNIDTLVSIKGVAVLSDRKLPLPYCDDTATYQRSIIVGATNVTISGYTNSHALTGAHVIMEYTEATVTKRSKKS